jgi:hypothetical protein
VTGGTWPGAGTPPVDFIATLPIAGLHLQRLLWSRQIESRMTLASLKLQIINSAR